MNRIIKEAILLTVGSFLFAFGVTAFSLPNELSEGGVIGLTIIAYYLFGWSTGIVNFVLNAVLLVVGYKFFGRKTMIYTIVVIVLSSVFLSWTEGIVTTPHNDTLLAAIYSGVFVGIGLGMIFRAGGTSGGSAILAQLGHQMLGWSVGKGMLLIDFLVIAGGYFVIGAEKSMCTLLAVFIGARVIDFVIEGLNRRTAVTIISDNQKEIRQEIMQKMARGVTILDGRGGYTDNRKEILYVVINKPEVVRLKSVVGAVDPNAFVVIHDVRDVLGSGFEK